MFIWTIGDALTTLAVVFAFVVIGAVQLRTAIKVGRCKHDGGVRETMACDAICVQCGGNLGFIGTWREKHPTDTTVVPK